MLDGHPQVLFHRQVARLVHLDPRFHDASSVTPARDGRFVGRFFGVLLRLGDLGIHLQVRGGHLANLMIEGDDTTLANLHVREDLVPGDVELGDEILDGDGGKIEISIIVAQGVGCRDHHFVVDVDVGARGPRLRPGGLSLGPRRLRALHQGRGRCQSALEIGLLRGPRGHRLSDERADALKVHRQSGLVVGFHLRDAVAEVALQVQPLPRQLRDLRDLRRHEGPSRPNPLQGLLQLHSLLLVVLRQYRSGLLHRLVSGVEARSGLVETLGPCFVEGLGLEHVRLSGQGIEDSLALDVELLAPDRQIVALRLDQRASVAGEAAAPYNRQDHHQNPDSDCQGDQSSSVHGTLPLSIEAPHARKTRQSSGSIRWTMRAWKPSPSHFSTQSCRLPSSLTNCQE